MKVLGVKWLPKPDATLKGRIVQSIFFPCHCHEETKDGRPKKGCKVCNGKGGTTSLWVEPLIQPKESI